MACLKGPTVSPPALPAGISLPVISLPVPPALNLCCRLILPFPSSVGLPPIPIPGAALAAIMSVFDAVNAALDLLEIDCPLE